MEEACDNHIASWYELQVLLVKTLQAVQKIKSYLSREVVHRLLVAYEDTKPCATRSGRASVTTEKC